MVNKVVAQGMDNTTYIYYSLWEDGSITADQHNDYQHPSGYIRTESRRINPPPSRIPANVEMITVEEINRRAREYAKERNK